MLFFKELNDLYNKSGYFDKYGSSFYITVLIFLIVFLFISLSGFENFSKEVSEKWDVNKCNPIIIPFAGLINKKAAKENGGAIFYTTLNAQMCINALLKNLAKFIATPALITIEAITATVKATLGNTKALYGLLHNLRSALIDTNNSFNNRLVNASIALLHSVEKGKDSFSRLGFVNMIFYQWIYLLGQSSLPIGRKLYGEVNFMIPEYLWPKYNFLATLAGILIGTGAVLAILGVSFIMSGFLFPIGIALLIIGIILIIVGIPYAIMSNIVRNYIRTVELYQKRFSNGTRGLYNYLPMFPKKYLSSQNVANIYMK